MILLGGYVIADAVDVAPGFLTAADVPSEPRAYPEVADFEVFDAHVPPFGNAADLSPEAIATAAEQLAADPRNTGSTAFAVRDLEGNLLYEMAGNDGKVPASNMKVLTAAAALAELGPNTTLPTSAMLAGDTLYLVGGGDIYLALDQGDPGARIGRAGLGDLADQVTEMLTDRGVTSILLNVDSSLFSGANYNDMVQGIDRSYIMPMRPLAIDRGRLDGFYSATPDIDAGNVFAERLRERGIEVQAIGTAVAPSSAQQVGVVHSAPIRDLVDHCLTVSDNSMAEVLGHLVAIERGLSADFGGAAKGVRDSITEQGFATTGLIVSDTAGLSTDNRVSASLLTEILVEAAVCTECPLSSLPHGMPVAGLSGTLTERFWELESSGLVRAKTGTLVEANSLSGYVTTSGGHVLTFSILIDGLELGTTAIVRPAIDEALNALAMGEQDAG
nr:D-alanyl-D-alanine carboxypeptidase/D-alanyl-D-alanine-endopeptidase [Flaviflexus huanghaiensis]